VGRPIASVSAQLRAEGAGRSDRKKICRRRRIGNARVDHAVGRRPQVAAIGASWPVVRRYRPSVGVRIADKKKGLRHCRSPLLKLEFELGCAATAFGTAATQESPKPTHDESPERLFTENS
jgi:hypothetical protein